MPHHGEGVAAVGYPYDEIQSMSGFDVGRCIDTTAVAGTSADVVTINGSGTVLMINVQAYCRIGSVAAFMNNEVEFIADGVSLVDCDDEGLADIIEICPVAINRFGHVRGLTGWNVADGAESGYIKNPLMCIPFNNQFVFRVNNLDVPSPAGDSRWWVEVYYIDDVLRRVMRAEFTATKAVNNLPAASVDLPLLDIVGSGVVRAFQYSVQNTVNAANRDMVSFTVEIDGVPVYVSPVTNIRELSRLFNTTTANLIANCDGLTRFMFLEDATGRSGFIDWPHISWRFNNRFRVLHTNPSAVDMLIRNRVIYHNY